jgi:hypothetical protein
VEGPVPLNDVGPPAVPLGPPAWANAKVPYTANADASRIGANFMTVSFLLRETANRKGGKQCDTDQTHRSEAYGMVASSVYAKTENRRYACPLREVAEVFSGNNSRPDECPAGTIALAE